MSVDDGRRLHLCAQGDADVSVLFESGLGDSRNAWSAVAPRVAEFAHTVVYDRAGLGRSDAAGVRDLSALVSDHLAVREAAVPGDFIAVGHSYGGLIARLATTTSRGRCRGMVLVDEVTELCDEIVDGRAMRGAETFYRLRVLAARMGVLHRFARQVRPGTPLPPEVADVVARAREESLVEDTTVEAARAAQREWREFTAAAVAARARGPVVPAVPITSISTHRGRREDPIMRAHRELVGLSPQGRHVVAGTRSHRIHLDEPDLVAVEIERSVTRARRARAA